MAACAVVTLKILMILGVVIIGLFGPFIFFLKKNIATSKFIKSVENNEQSSQSIITQQQRRPPYWPRYGGSRHVILLDGKWHTGNLPPDTLKSFDSMDPAFNPTVQKLANYTTVPSCVDVAPPGYLGYRGVTFYRTYFDYDLTKSPARLQFQACSFYCRVWVNGIEIGDHRSGGYVAFTIDISMKDETKNDDNSSSNIINRNELFVLADSRFNMTTAPMHTGGDFWHYGGLMRSVELHALPRPSRIPSGGWPWRLYVQTKTLSSVHLILHLTNAEFTGNVTGISITFDKDGEGAVAYSGFANNGVVDLGIVNVPNPRVWSTYQPNLHTVTVTLNDATVTERFGLRIFGVDNDTNRLTLNGKVLKLVGWNHHTQFAETGASPSVEELDADILLLKQGGANYVRGAHYPQDPRWLDRLDEEGVVMWSETLGPGVRVHHTKDQYFVKYQMQQLKEMMDNAMNHASIMTWGFFNEGESDHVEACSVYKLCSDYIKSRDPTRFVTWASNKLQRDKCLEYATLISFNNYPGWYSNQDPKKFWNTHADDIRSGKIHGTESGKPFVISETGAGGIYEWSTNKTFDRWTLNYQTKIITEDVDVAIANSNISGITLWHFFDFKVDDNNENNSHCDYIPDIYPPVCRYINVSSPRPGGLNHKGVLDFWRREKPVYKIVASKFNATKENLVVQESVKSSS